jgi:hypothetical protein
MSLNADALAAICSANMKASSDFQRTKQQSACLKIILPHCLGFSRSQSQRALRLGFASAVYYVRDFRIALSACQLAHFRAITTIERKASENHA